MINHNSDVGFLLVWDVSLEFIFHHHRPLSNPMIELHIQRNEKLRVCKIQFSTWILQRIVLDGVDGKWPAPD